MNVVDLRNTVTSCNDELIEVGDALIYYAEEKMEEGHPSLFLLVYNRVTSRERVLANWLLPRPACVEHFFSFPEDIVIVMEAGGSEAWVIRLDKKTGAQRSVASLSFFGDFQGCVALDEEHLLFFTGTNEKHAELFRRYQKLTGFSRVAYLYDLEEGQYSYVRDPRVCRADISCFVPYRRCGMPQLLVLEPNGSEDKRNNYRNQRWLGDHVDDNVWDCPLHDFIVSIRNGEARAPLELVFSAGTAGLVRYAGQDESNLYFRAKYFPTGDQRVCAYGKERGRRFVAAKLTPGPETGTSLVIDREGGRAYRVVDSGDEFEVTGLMNSSVRAGYPKELGSFITCVEDRFIIARSVLSDEHDSFEFSSVYDIQTGAQKSYEGRCFVSSSTVVLYQPFL